MKPILNFPAAILWFGALDMGGIMPCIGYNDSLSAGNNKHVENQHIQSSEKTNANGVWKYDEELQERSFTARVLTEERHKQEIYRLDISKAQKWSDGSYELWLNGDTPIHFEISNIINPSESEQLARVLNSVYTGLYGVRRSFTDRSSSTKPLLRSSDGDLRNAYPHPRALKTNQMEEANFNSMRLDDASKHQLDS
ncbi:hypothetical protein ABG067_000878 [Albugo candida]